MVVLNAMRILPSVPESTPTQAAMSRMESPLSGKNKRQFRTEQEIGFIFE